MTREYTSKLSHPGNRIVLIILGTIFINFVQFSHAHEQSTDNKVCTTKTCYKEVKSIKKNMNTESNPCDNFYLFTCGTYVKYGEVPRGQPFTNPLTIIRNEVREILKADLEEKAKENEPRTFKLLRSYYKSCLNANETDKWSIIFEITTIVLGRWPVVEGKEWHEESFDWIDVIVRARQLGLTKTMNSIIDLKHEVGNRNQTYIIIKAPSTGLDEGYLLQGMGHEKVQEYYEEMIVNAEAFGAEGKHVKEELKKSLEFEMKLAKLPKTTGKSNFTIEELAERYPEFPWAEYLSYFQPKNVELYGDQTIVIDLKAFDKYWQLLKRTEKRVMANYIIWRAVYELDTLVTERIDSIPRELMVDNGHRLWKSCVDYFMENMPLATGAFYVRKHFINFKKEQIEEMAENLRKVFKLLVSETSSMNDETKAAAQKKLDYMKIHIAYPDLLLNDTMLDAYFEDLPDSDNFIMDHMSLMGFVYDQQVKKTLKYLKYNNWVHQGASTSANAEYIYKSNSLNIYAAILQWIFFNPDRPNYLNYAGIGKVLGHEMGHSLDTHGSKFDEHGVRRNWWDSETWKQFQSDVKCLKNQYSSYKASKRKVPINGTTTVAENIADNLGYRLAYRAYEEWVKENGEEPGLPGFPYSPRQLFWLGLARTECHRIRQAGWDNFMQDSHTPGPFRINIPFSNIPEFARDWKCKAGTRMNPVNKCKFWWDRKTHD